MYSAYELLPLDADIIDIGADKGLLSVFVARHNPNLQVYATENKKGPFSILEKHLKESQADNVKAIFADGLDKLPLTVRTVSILGMGGETIYEILSRHPEKLNQIDTFVIEPQSAFVRAISYLLDNGYENDQGCYVFEKHHYPLLRFVKGAIKKEYTLCEKTYSPYCLSHQDPLLKEFLVKELSRYERMNEVSKQAHEKDICLLKEALTYYE